MEEKDNKQVATEGSSEQVAVSNEQEVVVAEAPATEEPKKIVKRKKAKRSVPVGQMHIQATFNNTIVSFTDQNGNVLSASSAGACGFRGSKKGTAYAAQVAVDKASEMAKSQYGLTKIAVFVKGVGLGRDAAIRAVLNHDMLIESITDATGVPHGGVRPKRQRRA